MNSVHLAAERRNTYHHPHVALPIDPALTAGGKLVFLRTRRPVPTCNAIAALAGVGPREA
jgi:hypothetical protein